MEIHSGLVFGPDNPIVLWRILLPFLENGLEIFIWILGFELIAL